MKNLFYFRHLNIIGGIEQFFAYLSEKYRDWDITIVFKSGDPKQIARLRRYARVIKFAGQHFDCDKAFFCFNHEIRDFVHAKETALVLHGDYLAMVEQGQLGRDCYIFASEFDKYYGVSQVVCDSWKKITGLDCTLVYNPYVHKPSKKILRLVYCGRLSPEKGGDLVDILLQRLDARGIEYQLWVYSNKSPFSKKSSVYYLDTRLDACQFLNQDNYDYMIVPSKNEGYCYSLVQALANGLPVVATPCPVFKELGVSKKNSISIAFDGSNVDEVIDAMLTKSFSFTYTPKNDSWDKILAPGESTYHPHCTSVRVVKKFYDVELEMHMKAGDVYETTEERMKLLTERGLVVPIQEE